MKKTARIEAKKQWNAKACGELPGFKDSVEYFDSVAKDRYNQQPWVHNYFNYNDFKDKHILEIGIGQGTDMMQFACGGAICHGVDITQNHLELTSLNAKLRNLQVDLHESDATNLPFESDSMDCVYSFGVLHHIPEIEKVIDEIYRVLKPNGIVMIALYHKWSAFHIFSKIFYSGLCKGWLFTKGYNGLLSTIEKGADGVKIKPYVRLYDKKDVTRLMDRFYEIDVSVKQLHSNHFWPQILAKCMKPFISLLESKLGWYVAYKGRK